jgi:hypothetical protein
MKIDIWKLIFRFFLYISIIELIGVLLWTLSDVTGLFIFIITSAVISFGYWTITSHKRRKELPQNDERLQKHAERSLTFAGLAGLAILLQVTIVEIITGVNFKPIEVFGIVIAGYYVVAAATYLIQNKVR